MRRVLACVAVLLASEALWADVYVVGNAAEIQPPLDGLGKVRPWDITIPKPKGEAAPEATTATLDIRNSRAFSTVTPPVGMRRMSGNGPRMSLKYLGPNDVAGNTLTMSAPSSAPMRAACLTTSTSYWFLMFFPLG